MIINFDKLRVNTINNETTSKLKKNFLNTDTLEKVSEIPRPNDFLKCI